MRRTYLVKSKKSQQIHRNDVTDKEAEREKQKDQSRYSSQREACKYGSLLHTWHLFSFFFGVSNKNWHYMFFTLLKILSLIFYKNKETQNKTKATSHKNLQLHEKKKKKISHRF